MARVVINAKSIRRKVKTLAEMSARNIEIQAYEEP
jgi:hypothetical protein